MEKDSAVTGQSIKDVFKLLKLANKDDRKHYFDPSNGEEEQWDYYTLLTSNTRQDYGKLE